MNTRTAPDTDMLMAARTAHLRRDWPGSYDAFALAADRTPLSTDDLDSLAWAAWRMGRGKESVRVAERVFTQLARTDPSAAAMKAVELALVWLTRGDLNIGQGWMNRARRLLDGATECPTHGYLAYLDAVVALITKDTEALISRVQTMHDVCGRLNTPALTALCHVVEGLQAIQEARMEEAYGLIDEAMLPVLADQVPIDWAGEIYCVVLLFCHRLADLPRMQAWTQSMERWCQNFAGSSFYGGVCDVRRLQIHTAAEGFDLLEERLFGASRALEESDRWAAAEGYYELGEVRRRRGDVNGAFAAFTSARALGVEPQPGEALLRCQLGDSRTAWTDLRVALAGEDRLGRMRLLRGAVEIALARGHLEEAERHCDELESGAMAFGTPGFCAWAAHARGVLLVRQQRHREALEMLQAALREYRVQQDRYETAHVYEWLAAAHKALGDDELAAADYATAENIYCQLGVEPAGVYASSTAGGLTKRELEVLTHIASGATNRQVATDMFISEKTVGRHLANIYAKLGVSSRTAAVAWAHTNKLL
jgi:DNA-binding NarL/FixJ family response regulator